MQPTSAIFISKVVLGDFQFIQPTADIFIFKVVFGDFQYTTHCGYFHF